MTDHYATWFGMLFCVLYLPLEGYMRYVESLEKKQQYIRKLIGTASVLFLIYLWYVYVYMHDKYTYNKLHPYTSWIPIHAYIILRNLFPTFRIWFSGFLAWFVVL